MSAVMLPESIHPDLWKGNQLARAASRVVPCGDDALAAELPGGGWPRGALTDLLIQQTAFAWWGLDPASLMTVKAPKTADALWAAEQILRAGTCGALVFWQQHVRPEAVRRLHLAAQTSESLFFMVRPLATTRDASPAPLRLAIRAAKGGVDVQFLKRRGPARDESLFVSLTPSPILNVKRNATVDRRPSPVVVPRSVPAEVVA